MSPMDFASTYRPVADEVSAGTGIDPIALLSQWANETAFATSWAGAPFNLGNIHDAGGNVVHYPSLDAFAQACIATFHNGLYNDVLTATNAVDQLAAIVASPWSAGHYGGTLMPFYTQLEAFELTPQEHADLETVKAQLNTLYQFFANPADPRFVKLLNTTLGEVDTIQADVQAIKTSGVPVDFSTVLSAIAAVKTDVDAVKVKTDRDLA